jgi:PleD family two-component response regulator
MDDRLLAVVPHTGAEGARILAERVLRGVRELRFESDGRQVSVTVSIGGTHNAGGVTPFFDTLLQAAEGALQEASAAGGDRYLQRDPDPSAG